MNRFKQYIPPSILLLTVFVLLALSGVLTATPDGISELFFTHMILQIVIFILPALFYCKIRHRKVTHETYSFAVLPAHPVFLLALFGVIVLGSMLINLGVTAAFAFAEEFGTEASVTLTGITDATEAIYVVFSFCILPAITEEFFFRGVLMSEYADQNPTAAVLLSTLAFAASHFELTQMPAYLFSGLLLAFAVRVTHSLIPAILLHCAVNLFNVFLLPYLWQLTLAPLGVLFTVFILVGLILVFALVALRETEQIYTDYASDPRREKDSFGKPGSLVTTMFHGLLSPPFAASLVLALILALAG
ncbi:MAG: CPBP family intramembrane metalloprotease [Clostridia bacterium]|nr:CPBP family intramembrane metalloprotease [Clostridia bacterium]